MDFFATESHYIDHMAPIWGALPPDLQGHFFASNKFSEYARTKHGIEIIPIHGRSGLYLIPIGETPLLTSGYQDLHISYRINRKRQQIFMEHGVGITFKNPGYAGGKGDREHVSLFLAPNEYIKNKTAAALPDARQVVIGTPKLDKWANKYPKYSDKPTVCISFHWSGKVAPEGGNALRHYRSVIPTLAKNADFTLIGHGHPREMEQLSRYYTHLGIEVVRDFDEVMERADLYINDCSSTLYEFCVTGKPVIILNAPWFRRDVQNGIRFWDYTDVGPQVEDPDILLASIEHQLEFPNDYAPQREKMIQDLYPNLGTSAQVAARALGEFING